MSLIPGPLSSSVIYIFLQIHIERSIENHAFTVISPVSVQCHRLLSCFLPLHICNFLLWWIWFSLSWKNLFDDLLIYNHSSLQLPLPYPIWAAHPMLGHGSFLPSLVRADLKEVFKTRGHGLCVESAGCLPWQEVQSPLALFAGLEVSLWHSWFHSSHSLKSVTLCVCSPTLNQELIRRWPPHRLLSFPGPSRPHTFPLWCPDPRLLALLPAPKFDLVSAQWDLPALLRF